MSDTSPSETAETDPAAVRPPRTVTAAFVAVCVQVGLAIIGSLLLFGASDYLRHEILKANNDAAAKHKSLPYDLKAHDLAHYVHQSQTSSLISSLLFGAIFVLLAVLFWRGKGWARWVLILAAILTQQPFRVLGFGGDAPASLKATIVLGGAASLVSIVLLLLPESNHFFAAKRGPRAGQGAVPGAFNLRTLFMPRAAQRPAEVERKEPAVPPARPRTEVVRPPEPKAEPAASAASTREPADVAAPRAKAKARVAPAEPAATRPAGKPRNKAKGR